MKKIIFSIILTLIVICSNASNNLTTHLIDKTGQSICGSYTYELVSLTIYSNVVGVQCRITAIKDISSITFYNGSGRISFGNTVLPLTRINQSEKKETEGFYGYYSEWCDAKKLRKGESRNYTLWFGFQSKPKQTTIPHGVSIITIDGIVTTSKTAAFKSPQRTLWNQETLSIKNIPVKETNFHNEQQIKNHIDLADDRICGIYKGDDYTLACTKKGSYYELVCVEAFHYPNYYNWTMGNLKADLYPSSTPDKYDAIWYMANREEEIITIIFDGSSMLAKMKHGDVKYKMIYPTPLSTLLNEPITLLKNDEYKSAIASLSNLIHKGNRYATYDVYMLRAYAYTSMELYKSAIEDYTKALQLKPGDTDAYYARGLLKLQIEDVTGIDDLKKSGDIGRAILLEYDLLDFDPNQSTSKPQKSTQKKQIPTLKKQSIPQLK